MDWNGDGLKDLLVGENNGNIRYFQNVGSVGNPSLHYVGLLMAGGTTLDVGDYSTVWTDDWNEDGLVDVIAGASDGYIHYYQNTGTTTNPVLAAGQYLTLAGGSTIDVGNRSCPNVADYNGDGIKDLISGDINGKVFYYQNNGTNANPQLANGVSLYTGSIELKTISTSRLATVDWNNDGDLDIVIGNYDPRLKVYLRTPTSAPAPSCDLTNLGGYAIPPEGGTLSFSFAVNNQTGSTVTFDGWTDVALPNYQGFYGPLLAREDRQLNPYSSISPTVNQVIPGSAPAGYYYYYGYVGDLSAMQVYYQDYIYFYKTGDDSPGSLIGDWNVSGWEEEAPGQPDILLPDHLSLSASPNPFNPATTLRFDLPEAGSVEMAVFNATGQKVSTLVNGYRDAGQHEVTWDASGLPAGVYLVAVKSGTSQKVQKVLLVK